MPCSLTHSSTIPSFNHTTGTLLSCHIYLLPSHSCQTALNLYKVDILIALHPGLPPSSLTTLLYSFPSYLFICIHLPSPRNSPFFPPAFPHLCTELSRGSTAPSPREQAPRLPRLHPPTPVPHVHTCRGEEGQQGRATLIQEGEEGGDRV